MKRSTALKLLAAGAAGAAAYAFYHNQNSVLTVDRYPIPAKVSSAVHVIHLSDLHSKQFGLSNTDLLRVIIDEHPDFVVITGDFVDDTGRHIPDLINFLTLLTGVCPVYYITGNHEHRLNCFDSLMEEIAETGTMVLDNRIASCEIKGSSFHILGLEERLGRIYRDNTHFTDPLRGYRTKKLKELEGLDGVRIVLSHFPQKFALKGEESYCNFDFDLMFSGHAHGGQWIIPKLGPLFAPQQGVLPLYTCGVYGDHPKLVVSRGLGPSTMPFRLNNRPQVVHVILYPESAE